MFCALIAITSSLVGCTSLGQKSGAKRERRERRANMRPVKQAEDVSYAEADPKSSDAVDVMTINNERITAGEVLEPIMPDLIERSKKMPPDVYSAFLGQAIEARVRQLAREALVHQEAIKSLTDQESAFLDGIVDDRIKERINKEFGGRQSRFEKMLSDLGMTMDDARSLVRREIMIIRYLQMNIRPRVADPTREELWALYERERAELEKPERRKMRLIEVAIDSPSPEAREAARDRISQARKDLLAGADFSAVAKEHSTGLNATLGGEWGWVTKGSLRERYEPAVEAMFALDQTNVVSEPIETDQAMFLVMAAEIDPGGGPTFESLQPKLLNRYRDEQFEKLVDAEIRSLQSQAMIRPKDITRFLRAVAATAPQPSYVSAP